jgi:ketosteroid isomerase-like protein
MTNVEVRESFKRAGVEGEYMAFWASMHPAAAVPDRLGSKEELDAFLADAPDLALCVVGFYESRAMDGAGGDNDDDGGDNVKTAKKKIKISGRLGDDDADQGDDKLDTAEGFSAALGALASTFNNTNMSTSAAAAATAAVKTGDKNDAGAALDGSDVLFRRVDIRLNHELAAELGASSAVPCLRFYRKSCLVDQFFVKGPDPAAALSDTEVQQLLIQLSTPKMSFEQLEKSTLDAFAALNGADLESLLALFAEDSAVYDEFNGQRCEGKDSIREALAPQFDAARWGKVTFQQEGLMVDPTRGQTTLMWVCSNEKGEQYREWRGLDIFSFKYGRIVCKETYAKADRPLFQGKSTL